MGSDDVTPLELFHPRGIALRPLVLGNACPPRLRPLRERGACSSADLIVAAPTPEECATHGWIQESAREIARRLERDGLAYVLTPPRWRPRFLRELRAHGLCPTESM